MHSECIFIHNASSLTDVAPRDQDRGPGAEVRGMRPPGTLAGSDRSSGPRASFFCAYPPRPAVGFPMPKGIR